MSGWTIVVRRDTVYDGDYEVWLEEDGRGANDDPGANSLVLGVGRTASAALTNAWAELRELEALVLTRLMEDRR